MLTVYGVEYAFGAHDYPTSGVFEVEPRQCPGFKFRKSVFMGTTNLDPFQIREFMERQSANYNGDTYHLIVKNCNHFCEDICYKLTGTSIPKWVNRLARIGMWHIFILQIVSVFVLQSISIIRTEFLSSLQVPSATAYSLMLLKLPLLSMIQTFKGVIVRKED